MFKVIYTSSLSNKRYASSALLHRDIIVIGNLPLCSYFNINAVKRNNNLFSEMQFYFCKKYAVASRSRKNVLYIKKYI